MSANNAESATSQPVRILTTGEAAPLFIAPTTKQERFVFDSASGRTIVLCFFGSAADPRSSACLAAFSRRPDRFDDRSCVFFGVTNDPEDVAQERIREQVPGYRYFLDYDRAIAAQFGVHENPERGDRLSQLTYVLDERMRVFAVVPFGDDAEHHVQDVMKQVASIPPVNRDQLVEAPAPVLVVPRVFEAGLCRTLIEYYRSNGGRESGFMREKEGKTVPVYDNTYKMRRDQTIEDEDLRGACVHRMYNRLVPEILKAFALRATRIERYIVARYDGGSGGFFRAHRDNTTKGTVHRKFAVSINLNTGEYEGGQLRFPEFGQQRYAPPLGGAVVFSCSLLHEATPVTSGERFCFLPFLYDDQSAKIRAENQRFLVSPDDEET